LDLNQVFIGNNYKYSGAINQLKDYFFRTNVKIFYIASSWKKYVEKISTSVFLDLGWHHVYIINYLLNKNPTRYNKVSLGKKAGYIQLQYNNIPVIIFLSHDNNFNHYENKITISTDQGSFVISECNNMISIFYPNGLIYHFSDTGLNNELIQFNLWLNDKKQMNNKENIELVKILGD
jgi:predicted dehydrogenase